MSRARYYISFNAGVAYSEFFPSNEPKITWTKEGTEIFMRPRVDKFRIGRTKNTQVYDDLYTRFFDSAYFGTDLLYKINVLGVDKFFFIDPITSGKIDTQNAVYESTPDPNDEYRNILQQYEKKWLRGSGNPFNGVAGINRPTLDAGTFANVDFTTWSDVLKSVTYTNTTSAEKFARNPLAVTMTTNQVVVIIIKNMTVVAGDEPLACLTDVAGALCSNKVAMPIDGIYVLTATNNAGDRVQISQIDDIAGSSGSFDYEIYHYADYVPDAGTSVYNALDCVINNASWMNLSLDIVSSYLWNDALPTGHAVDTPNISTYFTANPTNDYVIQAAQNWNDIKLGRVDYWTSDLGSATVADDFEYSLKDIMDILKQKLRTYWFIDPDGKFRIEHEYYFRDFAVQADLTSATYVGDKPEVDVRVYNYEKEDSYTQLNYKENNVENEDWLTYPAISYSATLTSNNVKDITVNVTTDMKYIIDHPDDASGTGFCLLRCIPMGADYRLSYDQSVITPANFYPNGNLGWAYLFTNYWDYFAEAETGTVNNAAFTFTHVKEYLKQNNIKFRMAADLDWKKPFTLTEGTGWLEKAEYVPETGMYSIDVGFNPYSITIFIVDSEDMGIKLLDDDGATFIVQ